MKYYYRKYTGVGTSKLVELNVTSQTSPKVASWATIFDLVFELIDFYKSNDMGLWAIWQYAIIIPIGLHGMGSLSKQTCQIKAQENTKTYF